MPVALYLRDSLPMSDVQFPADPHQYPEPSQATTILVLGILGLILCQVLAPFAWVMGNRSWRQSTPVSGRLRIGQQRTLGRFLGSSERSSSVLG